MLWSHMLKWWEVTYIIIDVVVLILAYLKQYDRLKIVFEIDHLRLLNQGFHVIAWIDCYPDAEELLNSGMPTYFVDADDAGWRRPEDHTGVWYCIICQQSTNFVLLLEDRLQLRLLPAVKLLFWELLLRWLKVQGTSWGCLGLLLMSMGCILWQRLCCFQDIQTRRPFYEEQALLCRLPHSKRLNCCWY